MTRLQSPTMHPEIGPRIPVGKVGSGEVATGTIVFNQRPSSLNDPMDTIRKAIAEGDTTEGRLQRFKEAVLTPSTKEF